MLERLALKLGNSEYVIVPKADYVRLQKSAGIPPGSVDALEYARGSLSRSLAAARKQSGLTQAELAKRLGKRQPMISGAENGTVNVSERYVASVLKACGLPTDWTASERQKEALNEQVRAGPSRFREETRPNRFTPRKKHGTPTPGALPQGKNTTH